ncbi:conserved hypothetical protein [Histoplasma mississippiense (nom. inval.)]|uniref:conserved hypothetical protein n=1 Tax=Ajellomyces capsulatus (strain NAm1 / WU24) TaxID=2059318 RepID=UPI000157CD1B|nr:conserved hypothetical protein [Histoplasma mississippiense (nom. inval.)]EDN10361.1 conserved hypothetical protein [Histoplasma mississippiense (nom. inval.)]
MPVGANSSSHTRNTSDKLEHLLHHLLRAAPPAAKKDTAKVLYDFNIPILAAAAPPPPPPPPAAPRAVTLSNVNPVNAVVTNGASRAAAKAKPTPPAPPAKRPIASRKPAPSPAPRDSAVSMNSHDSSGGSGRATPNSMNSASFAGGLAEALRQRQSAMKPQDGDDW